MASLVAACRISAQLARRKLARDVAYRGRQTQGSHPAYLLPGRKSSLTAGCRLPHLGRGARGAELHDAGAVSTMTEGNIAKWQVKEGEKFAAGDVLLEIETDKATMDVEAQDDGVVVKIVQGDGSKAVKVGTRIAVLAEEGDDIAALEIPPDESPKPTAAKEGAEAQSKPDESATSAPSPKPAARPQKQTYPLLPSVAHLMKEHHLDEARISEMTPTGPNGRLLKGDVLVYLGAVNASVPADIEARAEKLSHLDLSNIKAAAAKAPEPQKAAAATAGPEAPAVQDLLVTLPVSLAAVMEVQKKVQDTLGVFMPLSTFIARATDLANDELPLSASARPSADELFNQVLGLDKAGTRGSRGLYLPQISALPPASLAARRPAGKKPDVIDMLAAGAAKKSTAKALRTLPGISTGVNVFSLVVPQAEKKRAKVFLERVKLVLEKEPGRLVL